MDNQVPARRKIAKRALMWVVHAGRPFKLRELALAVSIEPDSTSDQDLKDCGQQVILDSCGNLLAENDGIVRPVHYTVQEFLTASETNRMDGPGNSVVRQYQGNIHIHSELAQVCLQYLLFEEIRSCMRVQPAWYYDPEYPFGLYAAVYWDYHVQMLADSALPGDLVQSINKFLDSKGSTLTTAFYLRNTDYRPHATVNPLNYCLAFNLLHLYQLSHRLDTSSVVGEEHQHALHYAAAGGSTGFIDVLLRMGFSVHARDSDGECPLHYAASSGHMAAAELLLDRGADLRAASSGGSTALGLAANGGHETMVQILLGRGAAVNHAGGRKWCTALCAAALGGHQNIVQILLDSGANVNPTDGQVTALAAAAFREHQSIVQMLLDSGADINLTDSRWGTALGAAAEEGHQSIVQMLLDRGADVNLMGEKHASALETATRHGYKDIVRLLLDKSPVRADTAIADAI